MGFEPIAGYWFCKLCDHVNGDEYFFCDHCGAPFWDSFPQY